MITNLGHCGHMTWYILNIPDNIPSWDVMVASVWYILNVLNMGQFGMVLVLCPRPYNVLAMYQVSTSPLTPSVYIKKPVISQAPYLRWTFPNPYLSIKPSTLMTRCDFFHFIFI